MKKIKSKIVKFSLFIFIIASCLAAAALLNQPMLLKAVRAKFKSTDNFIVLSADPRIRYEGNSKSNAIALQKILQSSQSSVEHLLKSEFKKPIEVYVCATQETFNEYVFLSTNVRGAVYWGKLFLSPGAFSSGHSSLIELTTHELTHYIFYTHLGEKASVENIPLWFREGLAVFVANGGAAYTDEKDVFHQFSLEEKQRFQSGSIDYWFHSKDAGDAVSKAGRANWILYRVSALFVHYLHDSQPANFEKLISLLFSGTEFSRAVELSYKRTIESLLVEFQQKLSLVSD
ncbi:hypothetical protein ACO0LG_07820 [Undibacterium sp. Ji42W]|uniref:hypothetical protein n=1 Tax=Undibacterium sp. Ji42W TaxID=3413039 RepID=UPI003BF16A1C